MHFREADAEVVFQFTPLREGRQANVQPLLLGNQFQFTPLREGRRDDGKQIAVVDISIHAPPRGATGRRRCTPQSPRYFNSRPSARGDMISLFGAFVKPFQFTPLREGRRE